MTLITRRQFHKTALAAVAAATLPTFAGANTAPVLRAREGSARLAPSEYPETRIWGYGGSVPGPVLRARRGERMIQRLRNDLPQATSVHWHGIRIKNEMDGVAGMTQSAVAPGKSFFMSSCCQTLEPTGTIPITAPTNRWREASMEP